MWLKWMGLGGPNEQMSSVTHEEEAVGIKNLKEQDYRVSKHWCSVPFQWSVQHCSKVDILINVILLSNDADVDAF